MKKLVAILLSALLLLSFAPVLADGEESQDTNTYTAVDADTHHVVTEDGEEYDEAHDYGPFLPPYWGSNQCVKCQYACEHPNGFVTKTDYNPSAVSFEAVDESSHRVLDPTGQDIATFDYCPICNMIQPETSVSQTEYVEAHRFDENGKCSLCEYQQVEPSPSPTPTPEPTATPTPEPTATPTPEPTATPTPEPTASPTPEPTATPTPEPTATPTPEPTATPTPEPTATPTPEPTAAPVIVQRPAATPTPTAEPVLEEALGEELAEAFAPEGEDQPKAEVTLTVDADTGKREVAIVLPPPAENSQPTSLNATIPLKTVAALEREGVTEMTIRTGESGAQLTLNVAEISALTADTESALRLEMAEEPTLPEETMEQIAVKYTVIGAPIAVRLTLEDAEGQQTPLEAPEQTFLRMTLESAAENVRILYIDGEGAVMEAEAVYVEPTEAEAGYWSVPYLGEGTYLPVTVNE